MTTCLLPALIVFSVYHQSIKLEVDQYHFAFLYESKIWLGANNIAAISNRIDLLIIPLNKNKTEGITDSASDLNMLLFLKQIIQIAQYNTTNIVSTIRYMANASSDHHPNHVPGMLIIIKQKQPNPSYLFCNFNKFIAPFVFKAIFASNCKNNIRYHNNCNHYQSKYI